MVNKTVAIENDSHIFASMYVCICNGLKDKQLTSVIEGGACSVGEMFRKLGCQPVCGKCVPMLRDTLDAVRAPNQ